MSHNHTLIGFIRTEPLIGRLDGGLQPCIEPRPQSQLGRLDEFVAVGSVPRRLSENEHKWHVGLALACRSCLQMAAPTECHTALGESKKLLLRRSDTLPRAIAAS